MSRSLQGELLTIRPNVLKHVAFRTSIVVCLGIAGSVAFSDKAWLWMQWYLLSLAFFWAVLMLHMGVGICSLLVDLNGITCAPLLRKKTFVVWDAIVSLKAERDFLEIVSPTARIKVTKEFFSPMDVVSLLAWIKPRLGERLVSDGSNALLKISAEMADPISRRLLFEQVLPPIEKQRSLALHGFFTLILYLPLCGMLGGGLLYGYSFKHFEPLGDTLLFHAIAVGSVPYVIFLGLCYRTLRNVKSVAFVAFMNLATFTLLPCSIAMTLNGVLDRSQPATHEVTIVGKRETTGDQHSYYLKFESWKKSGKYEEVSVLFAEYAQCLPEKSLLEISTKSGFLGYPWIVTYRLKPM